MPQPGLAEGGGHRSSAWQKTRRASAPPDSRPPHRYRRDPPRPAATRAVPQGQTAARPRPSPGPEDRNSGGGCETRGACRPPCPPWVRRRLQQTRCPGRVLPCRLSWSPPGRGENCPPPCRPAQECCSSGRHRRWWSMWCRSTASGSTSRCARCREQTRACRQRQGQSRASGPAPLHRAAIHSPRRFHRPWRRGRHHHSNGGIGWSTNPCLQTRQSRRPHSEPPCPSRPTETECSAPARSQSSCRRMPHPGRWQCSTASPWSGTDTAAPP